MFEKLTSAHEIDPTVAWNMQFQELKVGLDVDGGEVQTLNIGPKDITLSSGLDDDCDLIFSSKQEAWDKFSLQDPPIGYQALSAMGEMSNIEISGSNKLEFFRHIMMLEKVFAQLRPTKTEIDPLVDEPFFEEPNGRYLNVNIWGQRQRIYVEEAGSGQPLLCLHTAGADSRQYRGLMNDEDVIKDHRVITFDLPAHGKSSPPAGYEKEQYVLTTDKYMEAVMAISQAMKLENPIVMGCSIGGRAVLHLALKYGDFFKAGIGLQSATHAESNLNEKLGLLDDHPMHRPDMHGGEVSSAAMRQIMSPSSPSKEYWETLWYYTQGGPGVFLGDLNYYFEDGDMRNGIAEQIDTEKCPIYLLTGEYDLSAPPKLTEELAELISAQHFQVMKGLGHFPMSENYGEFRNYLLPVLEKIGSA